MQTISVAKLSETTGASSPFGRFHASALVSMTGMGDLVFSLLYMCGGGPVTGHMEQDLYWRLRSLTGFRVIALGCLPAILNVSSYDFIMDFRKIL
jgi:hypothetical protein